MRALRRRARRRHHQSHDDPRAGAHQPPSTSGIVDESWEPAAKLTLGQDFTYRRPVDEATEVRVAQDSTSLDIAFVVTQREPRTEAQHTNGSSVQSDDYVGVYLFPQGTTGFQYSFFANPRGTRYQYSSENSAYTPQWTAAGHPTATGLRRDDAHPAQRHPQRRLEDVARAVHPLHRRNPRPRGVGVRGRRHGRD